MKVRTTLLIPAAFFCCSFFNDNVKETIQSALIDYYKTNPQEKIYIQTDQSLYVSGQTIWYKAFGTTYERYTTLSKIIYIQLVNAAGNVILLNKLPLLQGNANGSIRLPDTLKSGVYELRGFTAWMQNFDDEFIFHKVIYIQNVTDAVIQDTAVKPVGKFQIQFFPEGGDFVDSNLCHAAFKATDEYGLPAMITGQITDNDKKITEIHSIHDGMGEFDIKPVPGHKYMATVHFPDSSIQTVALPAPKPSGISIKIAKQTATDFNVNIRYRGNDFKQFQKLVLAAYQSDGKAATFPLELHRGETVFTVPLLDFSPGVLRLTVFDMNGTPQAERIIFIEPKNELQTFLHQDNVFYDTAKSTSFALTLKDENGKAVNGHFSVAVTNADTDGQDSLQDNIYTTLFLSEELKGYIHNPAWYFINTNDSTRKALDLVMQTSGWRHFKWQELLTGKPAAPRYAAEQDLYVAGEVVKYNSIATKDLFNLQLLIEKADSSKYRGYVKLNREGKFSLQNYNFSETSRLYFAGFNNKKFDPAIAVKFFTSPVDSILSVPAGLFPFHNTGFLSTTSWGTSLKQEQENRERAAAKALTTKSAMIKKIEAPEPTTEELIKEYTSPYFTSAGTFTIDAINNSFSRVPGFFQLIKNRLPALAITGTERTPLFELANQSVANTTANDNSLQPYPYFYLNEILVSYEDVRKIPLENVALVRQIQPPFFMAPSKGGRLGAIAVYLKKGKSVEFKPPIPAKKIKPFIYNGYNITREFFTPPYIPDPVTHNVSGTRRTLYWNPGLLPDENGGIHFSFYNPCHTCNCRIIIEGIDDNGRLLHVNTVFKVNKLRLK